MERFRKEQLLAIVVVSAAVVMSNAGERGKWKGM